MEDSRRRLLEKKARQGAAAERSARIDLELASLAGPLGLPPGFPGAEATSRALALLREVEEALAEERASAERTAREGERLAAESDEIARIEARLREELHAAGIPPDLSLPEALAAVEVSRRRLARRARLLEVEIPARREAVDEAEISRLEERLAALDAELSERRGTESPAGADVEPEEARREAEEAREALESEESALLTAERELAAAAREGGERARETEEALAETEALLDRAVLFRDAVDLAFGALTSSAAAVYGDFRRGLAEASRAILESWRVPWAALEFGDDLSVSAVAADGRTFTQAEIDGAFSTGAREQIHLTARLAVLRYLGAGGAGVPLLLDDPLTGTDDERFAAVMEFLISRVLPERPVLLVSCHGWRHERLRAALPPSSAGRLAGRPAPRAGGAGGRLMPVGGCRPEGVPVDSRGSPGETRPYPRGPETGRQRSRRGPFGPEPGGSVRAKACRLAHRPDAGGPRRLDCRVLVAGPRGAQEVAARPARSDRLGRPQERAQAGARPPGRHPPRHAGRDGGRAASRGPGRPRAREGRGGQARHDREPGRARGRRRVHAQDRREDRDGEAARPPQGLASAERVGRLRARARVEGLPQGRRERWRSRTRRCARPSRPSGTASTPSAWPSPSSAGRGRTGS